MGEVTNEDRVSGHNVCEGGVRKYVTLSANLKFHFKARCGGAGL